VVAKRLDKKMIHFRVKCRKTGVLEIVGNTKGATLRFLSKSNMSKCRYSNCALATKCLTLRAYDTPSGVVVVMITIFCDFCQFRATKLALFSKTNVMIKFLEKN
jgi:hypothetical protein